MLRRLSLLSSRSPPSLLSPLSSFSTSFSTSSLDIDLKKKRNIGISAHVDSGKTTLTERILYYTGKIDGIHDVKGKDGVGAKMDSMDLEREKGITIQSAATFCKWGSNHVNIIDTPGHVDFTIEVERALRVLDGAVLVLCGVSGVQSQSLTVDRQMKRYNVPRVAFINKLDRSGANPFKVIEDVQDKLKLNAAAVQLPVGLEGDHKGIIDIVTQKMLLNEGDMGEVVTEADIPDDMKDLAAEKMAELIERLADVDDEIGELFLMEETPTVEQLKAGIRRATVACNFVPVFMGSAFKNKGVQPLLNGVVDYLPSPDEKDNYALDLDDDEKEVKIKCNSDEPLVALAFKLEEGKFGQLTYMRVYQGSLKRGMNIINVNSGKKIKVPRIVRMHSDDMEDIESAGAGEVVAMFGIECSSMDSFTDGANLAMTSMFVPEPVMSISVTPDKKSNSANFGKALAKFGKEDPTLRISTDPISKQTILAGMGELHLEVYIERMKREYDVHCETGRPSVNYKESIAMKKEFTYLHKKQTGGSGQYAKVIGYVEPLEDAEETFEFDNQCVGTNVPPEYYPSCEKGAQDAAKKGGLIGMEVSGVRVVLQDGAAHAVDSSDMAFRYAMAQAVREAMGAANPSILEPIMKLDVVAPMEFQGSIVSGLTRRMGLIQNSTNQDDNVVIEADVPLAQMFGYSTDIRSITQGKGEFTMEYKMHQAVPRDQQSTLIKNFKEQEEQNAA
ncbi:hypothetical protein TrVE_jg7333 [Triparma verrucosa]|uniref:Elongation factor G, mitochondrial n=1 Tax=Triparma verrucosa TaxID=1606542 RepID=A0A9W7KWX5_9STRA|nr:hypothetical protein TrVE_jg7333 [Triparma verrucosa]